jgi:hypothetical protein
MEILTKKQFRKIKHHIQKLLRHSYWQYIEDIVTSKETEGTYNSMKKFWTYIKHQKNLSSFSRAYIMTRRIDLRGCAI